MQTTPPGEQVQRARDSPKWGRGGAGGGEGTGWGAVPVVGHPGCAQ